MQPVKPMPKPVLIVDDDHRNIFALSAVLRAKGFNPVPASDMKEAYTRLADNPDVGIILMDMMMPDVDGYRAIPELKAHERYSHIPIVAVTAQAMAGDREKCLAAGADNYLPKPVDVDKLVALLNDYLQ
jgi:CheY-like chemotaxis protein